MAEKVDPVSHPSFCKKCSKIYSHPLLLPCLHSFCRECVKDLAKTVGSETNVYCVVCNASTPMPSGGVDSFPTEVHLEHEAVITKYEASTTVRGVLKGASSRDCVVLLHLLQFPLPALSHTTPHLSKGNLQPVCSF